MKSIKQEKQLEDQLNVMRVKIWLIRLWSSLRCNSNNENARSRRTILASLSALGGVVAASGCCLPLAPFLLAAGMAGSSALFVKIRPFLLAISALLIGFGFYRSRRAKQCERQPGLLSVILLWFSAIVTLVMILFPQAIANLLANVLGG